MREVHIVNGRSPYAVSVYTLLTLATCGLVSCREPSSPGQTPPTPTASEAVRNHESADCPPLDLLEELHAAMFLLDVDANPSEVTPHLDRARSLLGKNDWARRFVDRTDAIVRARAEGQYNWK